MTDEDRKKRMNRDHSDYQRFLAEFEVGSDEELTQGFFDAFHCVEREDSATNLKVAGSGSEARCGFDAVVSPTRVKLAATVALESAQILADAARHGSVVDRREVNLAMADVIHVLVEPLRGRVVVQPGHFTTLSAVEDRLRHLRTRVRPVHWSQSFAHMWTFLGLAVTIAAGGAIVEGHFLVGAFFLALRIAVSVTMRTPGFASDGNVGGESWLDWRACVVSQVTDAIMLMSIPGYLLLHGDTGLGLATAFVPLAMLGATLLRVAAAQGGIVLGRLLAERVARNGTMLLGLLLASLFFRFGIGHIVYAISFATIGAALFAATEVARTLVYSSRRGKQDVLEGADAAFTRRIANVVPLVDAVIAISLQEAGVVA
jgi:hypothetical protein